MRHDHGWRLMSCAVMVLPFEALKQDQAMWH
jgi:hypothetical protein